MPLGQLCTARDWIEYAQCRRRRDRLLINRPLKGLCGSLCCILSALGSRVDNDGFLDDDSVSFGPVVSKSRLRIAQLCTVLLDLQLARLSQ